MSYVSFVKKIVIAGVASFLFVATSFAQSALLEKGDQQAFGNLKAVSQYGHVVFTDQPDEATIGMLKDQDIGLVLSIRGEAEDEGYDERKAVEEQGIPFIQIPYMKGRGIDLAAMDEILSVVNAAGENGTKMMLHCTHSQRAGSWLSAVLYRDHGVSKEEAMKIAKDAGLYSEFLTKIHSEFLDTLK
ncbi:hypothetical protein [Pseudemcibacter aquimaris]|uniref:hypothetical protein n=1 Tax=Pseudemcibacter aquimaris TaxID=2857064 RepID=UPI002012BD12|nr:hypothetical protein [Pseudemcibacter aquimaris]MCC3861112.1 hypothetical protein [Pseudemcibacter aquimaris]WDU59930.1 hypothetical protein KW060_06630 [Pseudemcibacter aquimaris]